MKDEQMIINLSDKSLNEESISRLGGKIKYMMWAMFGHSEPLFGSSVKVKGTKQQIQSFAAALAAEGSLMKAVQKHGLNDPRIQNSKTALNMAVSSFERDTGIVWPFK